MESFEIGTLTAVINKLQTTADGGARLTLDLSGDECQVIEKLIKHKLSTDGLVTIGIVGVVQ
jgi:hypothetical protein